MNSVCVWLVVVVVVVVVVGGGGGGGGGDETRVEGDGEWGREKSGR